MDINTLMIMVFSLTSSRCFWRIRYGLHFLYGIHLLRLFSQQCRPRGRNIRALADGQIFVL